MTPFYGALSPPVDLISAPFAARPTGEEHDSRFKGVQGFIKRLFRRGIDPSTRAPFTLLRGDHKARTKKAKKLRQKIDCTTVHMRSILQHTSNLEKARHAVQKDLEKLHRYEEKLRCLVHLEFPVSDVLHNQVIERYLSQIDDKHMTRRKKKLAKLQTGPLSQLRSESPILQSTWSVLEREKALQHSVHQIQALWDAYSDAKGPPKISSGLMKHLVSLSNCMDRLYPGDDHSMKFLYLTMKLMYERGRNTGDGVNKLTLLNLWKDLSTWSANDPAGLRSQLQNSAIDFYLNGTFPVTTTQSDHLDSKMDTLLDGLTSAALLVLVDELIALTPDWANDLQSGLFGEAKFLYNSVVDWQRQKLDLSSQDTLLQYAPAKVVDTLIREAMSRALGISDGSSDNQKNRPAKNWEPLLADLTNQLSSVVTCIDQAFDDQQITSYRSPDYIQAIRQALMSEVLTKTGIWQEVERLTPAQGARSRLNPMGPNTTITEQRLAPTPAPSKSASIPIHRAFLHPPATVELNPQKRKAIREAETKLREAVTIAKNNSSKVVPALLNVCQNGTVDEVQAFLSRKADMLSKTHISFAHHRNAIGISWESQLEALTANYLKDNDNALIALNTGLLRNFIDGKQKLVDHLPQPLREQTEKILVDIWTAIRVTTGAPEITTSLQKWCNALNNPDSLITDNERRLFKRRLFSNEERLQCINKRLFLLIEQVRGKAAILSDGTIALDLLLQAAMRDLSDTELGYLLANEEVSETGEAIKQRLSNGLDELYKTTQITSKFSDVLENKKAEIDHLRAQLRTAAQAEASMRLDAHKQELTKKLAPALLAEAGRLYALVDSPQAQEANGQAALEVSKLIYYAIDQASAERRYDGPDDPEGVANNTSTRFVRTVTCFQLESVLAAPLYRLIAPLYADLEKTMSTLNYPTEQPTRVGKKFELMMTEIINDTGVWLALKKAAAEEIDTVKTGSLATAPMTGVYAPPAASPDIGESILSTHRRLLSTTNEAKADHASKNRSSAPRSTFAKRDFNTTMKRV